MRVSNIAVIILSNFLRECCEGMTRKFFAWDEIRHKKS